jgi:hypothetical protein
MNSKRVFYLMIGGLIVLVLGILGSTYLASSMLSTRAKTLSDLKLKNQVLSTEQTGLIKAKKDIAKYTSLEKIAKTIVPQDKDQAQTVREIVKLASDSGIKPTSITFPASTLGAPAAGATSTGAADTPATSKASSAAAGLTQLTPVKGATGLYILPIIISQDSSSPVPYARLVDFLSRLEQNRRTAQVSSIVLQPSSADRNMLSFTLTVDEYIKP